VIEYLHN
jgi:serine/threonine protein kinase